MMRLESKYTMLLSIIIVAKDEEDHIENCIDSVLSQVSQLNRSDYEIILVDSLSTDDTVMLATRRLESMRSVSFKILSNEGVSLAKGWNLGIKAASGKYVLRPDAHAELKSGYIDLGLRILEEDSSIDAVGGVLETKVNKSGYIAKGIQFFLTSFIGMGNSNFRVGKKSGFFDTVLYAIYKRSLFSRVGYFDETLHRHEDTEMHGRLIASGARLYTSNNMIAVYYGRNNLRKISQQMFLNGYFSYEVPIDSGLKLRHLTPALFFGGLFLLLILSLFNAGFIVVFACIVLFYISTIIFASLRDKNGNIKFILSTVLVVVVGHSSYACGYFKGLIKRFFVITSNIKA